MNSKIKISNKNTKWLFLSTAFFFVVIFAAANAQNAVAHTTAVSKTVHKKVARTSKFELQGKVTDSLLTPLQDIFVGIKGTENITITDSTGTFYLRVKKGDVLVIDAIGFKTKTITVSNDICADFILTYDNGITVTSYPTKKKAALYCAYPFITTTAVKRRSFFGRIFYRIGNLFR